jgi:C_GCAxxG_C_C family probable redox protein
MLAVGEQVLGYVDDQTVRMTTGFSGGSGGSHRDMCGALSAGIMVIGSLHGRTSPNEDDSLCQELVLTYRDRFTRELGSATCHELRSLGYGSQAAEPCSVLVGRAAVILLDVLHDTKPLTGQ